MTLWNRKKKMVKLRRVLRLLFVFLLTSYSCLVEAGRNHGPRPTSAILPAFVSFVIWEFKERSAVRMQGATRLKYVVRKITATHHTYSRRQSLYYRCTVCTTVCLTGIFVCLKQVQGLKIAGPRHTVPFYNLERSDDGVVVSRNVYNQNKQHS